MLWPDQRKGNLNKESNFVKITSIYVVVNLVAYDIVMDYKTPTGTEMSKFGPWLFVSDRRLKEFSKRPLCLSSIRQ